MEQLVFASDEYVKALYDIALEVFNGGIYVFCSSHLCGWDFIDFAYAKDYKEDILAYRFKNYEITHGIYKHHILEGMTLKQILETVGEKGFTLEIPTRF